MGLTTAMYTGLTGMNANQNRINVIGNNIANVNTTAFKESRALFQSQFSYLLSAGNAPGAVSGGVNPMQLGQGVQIGAVQRDFSPAAVETTGIASDLAIEGDGLFIVQKPDGSTMYTRDGSFSVDVNNQLVTSDGYHVRGFGVDENYSVIPNVLTNLSIPLGTLSLARPTTLAQLDGDLSADGVIATQGSVQTSQALINAGGAPADAGTDLASLFAASDPTTALFAAGTTITVSGATKGQRALPDAQFVVGTDGSTLGDFANWLNQTLGIQTDEGLPGSPGVTVENGMLVVRSNAGQENAIGLPSSAIQTDNPVAAVPFDMTQTQDADGTSVFTGFTVYDSLGTPVNVYATFTLEQTASTGPVWRYYLETPDADGVPRALGNGTVSFDNNGNFAGASNTQVQIDRSASGAVSPLTFDLDFTGVHGLSTATSDILLSAQDGFPPGTLVNYSVGPDGTINGTFSNGLSRTLGQVALAGFPNPAGLVADSENLYSAGPNSGNPVVSAPGLLGAGRILGGALELSNVDLAREFIGLITSSNGFQASSRVIKTSSDLLDQLMLIV